MALIAELIFKSPAGAKMQLLSMSGTEGLSKPFEYQVEILCDKADLDLKTFLGKSMTVAVEQPAGGTRYFNGLVARFVQSGRKTKHFYHYQATLRPWFWFLSRTQDCKIFKEDDTVVQIVEAVFNDHKSLAKFKKSLNATYSPWTYCVQYRESDMNFVSRMLEQEGIYYYFEHTKDGHEMVLCDNASAHRAVTKYKEIPYEANWTARDTITECITSWGASVQVLPTSVVLGDFDFERPSMALRKDHTVARSHDMASFEVFDYPGEYTKDADGLAYAKVRAQEQQAGFQLISGQTDSRGVTCGFTFNATGMANSTHNREYLVVSTSVYVEEGVQIGGEDAGNAQYSCDFQVMPTSDTFRAARVTPKPMVHGPQTAKVVGPKGEHIYTDKYGRVKVQFHWDRLGQKNEKSSCWMRVSQPWAGNGFGIISIPRIGDEVVVSFLEGDPDQPIITGRVYNAEFMPPYELPTQKHITTIYTRSVGSASREEANELKFCDDPGNEYISIQAQKDFFREVENDDRDHVKANQFIIVDGNREEKVAGTVDLTVSQTVKTAYGMDHQHTLAGDSIASIGGGHELKVGGDHKFDLAGDAAVSWGGKGELKVAQDLAMTSSGGNVDIKGASNVTIEAGTTLTLKAGGCSIVLGPGSLTIDGPVVNINCGGSGSPAKQAAPAAPADPQKPKEPEDKQDPHP